MRIFIFSFNRGQFLKNCIASIEKCANQFSVTIIDDDSTNSETLLALKELSTRYEIIKADNRKTSERKTGGLYGNMNFAMGKARSDGYEYALFIQDDMQLVRFFLPTDSQKIHNYFSANLNTIQYVPNFQRTINHKDNNQRYKLDQSGTAYLINTIDSNGKSNFSATGVFHVDRFYQYFHQFEAGEGVNSKKAQSLGFVKGKAVYPFMNWLPYPTSFRGKKRAWSHILMEYIGGAGYYPIKIMTEVETKVFMNRDPSEYPLMESYLVSEKSPRHDIWTTGGGEYNVISRGGWAAMLLKSGKKVNRYFKSLLNGQVPILRITNRK